ncbi:MAG: LysR family transcriptional regulator [Fluviicola sp.]|nr:LysR family transcriptional regulator [Fluviicola sp.]
MNYTLHQLKIFVEVAKFRSITKAANEMNMTQPALSIQLKQFQQQFDIPLVELIGKKIQITDFGETVLVIAKNILDEVDLLKYKTKAYSGFLTGKLKISTVSTGKYVIPYYLSGFTQQHKGIDLVLDVSNKDLTMKMLRSNEIDFAFVSVLPNNIDVYEEPLLENKLFKVINPKYNLNDLPIIFREEGSATRTLMTEFLGVSNERKSLQLTSNEAVKQAIIAGLGYSILPLIGLKNELVNQTLTIVPTEGLPISTYWRLIWLKNKKLSPIAQEFLQYIKENKQTIVQENFSWYSEFR